MNKSIRVFVLAIAMITLLAYYATGQSSNEFSIPLSEPSKRGKLKIHLNSGSIFVKGTARKDVLIKYSIRDARHSDPDDEEDIDEDEDDDNDNEKKNRDGLKKVSGGGIDLEVTETENVVKVGSDSWNLPITLEVEVPFGFDLFLQTYNNGEISVDKVQGVVELTNYNGRITALSVAGSVVANTYNGPIKVVFEKVTEGTPMSYSTFNGDIDVTFPASLKATVKMKTEQGSIYSGFDVQLKSNGPVQKSESKGGVYKVVVDEWKKADINGGGAEISMRNYNGDIILRKK
jgi:hypothetical protein